MLITFFQTLSTWCRVCRVFFNHIHIPRTLAHTRTHIEHTKYEFAHGRSHHNFVFSTKKKKTSLQNSVHAQIVLCGCCCCCRFKYLFSFRFIYQQLATTMGTFHFLEINKRFLGMQKLAAKRLISSIAQMREKLSERAFTFWLMNAICRIVALKLTLLVFHSLQIVFHVSIWNCRQKQTQNKLLNASPIDRFRLSDAIKF